MIKRAEIMMVAGEASGDAHAAKLAAELRSLYQGEMTFFGCAGPKMREAGVEAVVEADELSVVGLPEIAVALPRFISAFRELTRSARKRKPDAAVLIDFPDFNLKLARALKKQGVTVVYYICPQLWAWRGYRIRSVRRYIDLMLSILPFEKAWYSHRGSNNIEYVGNPLVREVRPGVSKEEFRKEFGIPQGSRLVALLPGSRHAEIVRILPTLLECARILKQRQPDTQFLIAFPSEKATSATHDIDVDPTVKLAFGRTYDALNAADVAAVASGTATLEAGMLGTPMVIVYKTSPINYKLLRPLIEVDHFGLINLIAQKRIVREMIQDELTPQGLAEELERLLDPKEAEMVRKQLADAVGKLGKGGASRRAAEAIIRLIEDRGSPA